MDEISEVLTRGVENIYPSRQTLEKVLRSGKKIKVYQGFDPSMPNLHLGNLVGLLKLRQFQDLGHEVIFLVGDFTGMIGDPTDKSSARPRLTREQVLKNAKNWKEQAGKILDFSGKNPAKLAFNSAWLDKVSFKDLIEITSHFTAQQMLERDFFQRRLKEEKPIFLHEFLYPVAQAIDGVEMNVDLEIGGSDQTFNILAGRNLMKALKGKEKFVLTLKLLVDAQGQKVGKTTGNALFLNASPADLYGGVMSFPDEAIVPGFELLTQVPLEEVRKIEKEVKEKPMQLKKRLAWEIVKIYHGAQKARKAQEEFEKTFQKREIPEEINICVVEKTKITDDISVLVESGLASSRSESKRLIEQKAVDFDGKTITQNQSPSRIKEGSVIKVGKRKLVKIKIK